VKYLLQRIAFYLFTAWAAITLNFFIPRMIPGDPVKSLLTRFAGQMNTDAINSLYVLFGIDKNAGVWSEYVDYWKQLAHGDLGLSFTAFPSPVSEVIYQALPWTVALVGITTIVSFLLGTGLGVLAGWRRGSWVDGLLPVTTFLSSVPYFWLGLVAIALTACCAPRAASSTSCTTTPPPGPSARTGGPRRRSSPCTPTCRASWATSTPTWATG
jgi:peptide/nickel transport system permease protein